MNKKMLYDSQSREKLKAGVDKLANAVKVTLGAKGRNVVLDRGFGYPHVTKDGVSVAREIFLEDTVENIGAMMVKEVANRTAEEAGDGTTTATVLAQALINSGLKAIASGYNPIDVKRGMDKACEEIVKKLKEISQPVEDKIEQIATISANNDNEIGRLIAQAMEKVGKDGLITVEEAKGIKTEIKILEGMQFDKGYISPYFVTDANKMEVIMENPYILLTDKKISTIKDLIPIFEKTLQTGRPFLIICDELEGEALQTIVMNKMNGVKLAAVRSPEFGATRKAILEDIATITGGSVISDDIGVKLLETTVEMLGECEKVVISSSKTTIIGGKGDDILIESRKDQIRTQIEENDSALLRHRLAKISGGVAVMYIGASTEVEMKEKRDRVDDALAATQSAVEEGIIPGGGVAYLRCQQVDVNTLNDDEKIGVRIVKDSLEQPLLTMISNAGGNAYEIISGVKKYGDNMGYNVRTGQWVDMLEDGVIDPTKVGRVALENAVSVAGMMLLTECVVYNINKEE